MQKQGKLINDYSGGLNNRFSAAVIADNQVSDAQNVFFDDTAPVSCQPNPSVTSFLPEGNAGNGLWTYKKHNGSQFLIASNVNSTHGMVYFSTDGILWEAMTDGSINTTSAASVLAGALRIVTPADMGNIVIGTQLQIDYDQPSNLQERVVVTAITATTFTATFVFPHTGPFKILGNIIFLNSSFTPEGVTFKDLFFLSDGNTQPLIFNGTVWTPAGSLNAATVVDATGAQVDAGTHYYSVSYTDVNGIERYWQADSNVVTADAAHTQIALTNIPLGTLGTTKRTIYRTKAGGSSYFKLADISDNSTTSYNDIIADAALGAALPVVSGTFLNNPVPKGYYPVVHQSRLHMVKTTGNPDTDYYSEIDFPLIFLNNFITLPLQSDIIWGAASFKGVLVYTSENDMFTLSGDNVFQQFTLEKTVIGIGCLFHRSLQPIYREGYQLLIFLSKQGWYAFDGSANPQRLSDNILPTFQSLLQPSIQYFDQLITTKADWDAGTQTPASSLDTATNPGDIQLALDATLTAVNNNIPWTSGAATLLPITGCGNNPSYVQWKATVTTQAGQTTIFPPNPNTFSNSSPAGSNQVGFDITVNCNQTYANRIIYTHKEVFTGATTNSYYIVNVYDIFGNLIATQTMTIGGLTVSTISFNANYVGSIRVQAAAQRSNLGDSAEWDIVNVQFGQPIFKPAGTWTSPVFDTLAGGKTWRNFLASFDLNNQNLTFGIRSGPNNPPTAAYTPILAGSLLTMLPNTDRYVQVQANLSLASNQMNLNTEDTLAKSYPANTIPQDLTSPLTNPFPFTAVATGATYSAPVVDKDQFGNTLNVLNFYSLVTGAQKFFVRSSGTAHPSGFPAWNPLVNTVNWTGEFKVKLVGIGVPTTAQACGFVLQDGAYNVAVSVNNNSIILRDLVLGADLGSFNFNANDGNYHTVRMTKTYSGGIATINVYLDNNVIPIITAVATAGAPSNNIVFGSLQGAPPFNYNLAYVAWDDGQAIVPTNYISRNFTPVLHDIFFSWLTSSGGIIPTTTVASTYFNNRYWCSAVELQTNANKKYVPGTENFNNIAVILDLRNAWTLKRSIYAGGYSVFQDRLWLITSRTWSNANSFAPNGTPAVMELGVNPLNQEISNGPLFSLDPSGTLFPVRAQCYFRTKKMDLGVSNIKEFRKIYLRYSLLSGNTDPIKIRAYVDDVPCQAWIVKGIVGGTIETELSFPDNGTQIGANLMLEVNNAPTDNMNRFSSISNFEIYSMEVSAIIFNERIQPNGLVQIQSAALF